MNFNNIRLFYLKKRITYYIVLLISSAIILLVCFLSGNEEMEISSIVQPLDLQNHPIYSQYNYIQNDTTINIGFQPLYLPTGIIFEVVKRDKILHRALKLLRKEIIYYPFLKGADMNYFLRRNKIDGGVGGDMPALIASSDFDVIIPVVLQKGNVSIVSNQPMLTNNMKGMRIGYPFGSISHYFLLELLLDEGIKESEVRLIPIEVTSMAKALHNDEIDLFSAWEPIVASALKQYPELFITYRRISTGYLYFSKDFATKNPEAVNYILAAIIRAIAWLKVDRNNLLSACSFNIIEMERLSGEKSILDVEEIADLVQNDILRYISNYSIVLGKNDTKINSLLHAEFRFLKELNKVPVNSEWEKVSKSFDRNLILEIYKQQKEYSLNEFDYDSAFNEN